MINGGWLDRVGNSLVTSWRASHGGRMIEMEGIKGAESVADAARVVLLSRCGTTIQIR
jgi:hypothetical protein